jgi:uncharacterized protein YifN (PemK superfamily)
MPHAFRTYKNLVAAGFPEAQCACVAGIVEHARSDGIHFSRESIVDKLFDSGLSEPQAEAVADVLRNCYYSEIFSIHFDTSKLKFQLVRAKMSAALADQFLSIISPAIVTRRDAYPRVPIKFAPSPGKVIMCDFTHLCWPEMVKERRAIVIAKGASDRCAVVVPVSRKPTNEGDPRYYRFDAGKYPFFDSQMPVWAICDHVYTVALRRMWQINVLRRPSIPAISATDLAAVKLLLRTSLGV